MLQGAHIPLPRIAMILDGREIFRRPWGSYDGHEEGGVADDPLTDPVIRHDRNSFRDRMPLAL